MGLFTGLFGPGPALVDRTGFFHMRGGGYRTDSGANVSEYNALKLPAVYACVGIISDAIAQLPMNVYRRGPDGEREHIRGHRVEYLLNTRPNPRMTAFSYRKTVIHHILLWGNGYSEIQRRMNGVPEALWLALPDRTHPELLDNGELVYKTTIHNQPEEFEAPDMLHIPALGFDGIVGYSPISVARQAVGLGMTMEEFAAKFYGNDAKSGGFIEHPGKLGEVAKANIQSSMEQQGGPENFHKVKVLEEGAKFHQTTIDPEDAQFIEGRDFQIAEIARLYRVPLHMIQSVSGSTSWGSGLTEMSMGFVRFTLSPWMIPIEQELNAKLFTEQEKQQGYYVRHDTSDLLKASITDRGTYYTSALDPTTGWLTREEVREKEDFDPLSPEQEARFGTQPAESD